jgi:hypothetical protein
MNCTMIHGFMNVGKNIVSLLRCWFRSSASMCNIKLIKVVSWAALNTSFKKGSPSADPLSWQFERNGSAIFRLLSLRITVKPTVLASPM